MHSKDISLKLVIMKNCSMPPFHLIMTFTMTKSHAALYISGFISVLYIHNTLESDNKKYLKGRHDYKKYKTEAE